MHIQMTREDVDKGLRCSCSECPIAIAISRATGLFAVVHWGYVDLYKKYRDWEEPVKLCIPLPQICNDFISSFDNDPFLKDHELALLPRDHIQPIEFDIPWEVTH